MKSKVAQNTELSANKKPCSTRVYPACAGIDPVYPDSVASGFSLPRMRGDRPYDNQREMPFPEFTPHARGSTQEEGYSFLPGKVYPACAGIDPPKVSRISARKGLPRMRGDRPLKKGG